MKFFEKIHLMIIMGWRNLWRQKRRSVLVMSTAMVGMMGLLLTFSLLHGMARMWVEGSIDSGIGHVQIRPSGFAETRKNTMLFDNPESIVEFAKKASSMASKSWAHGEIHYGHRFDRKGFIRLGSSMRGLRVTGIDPELEKPISKFDDWIFEGVFFDQYQESKFNGEIPCIIGKVNADKFEVEPGDSIILTIGGSDGSSRSVRAKIIGIFKSIAEPVDKYTLIVRRSDLSKLYGSAHNELSYTVFQSKDRKLASGLKTYLQNIHNSGSKNNKSTNGDLLTYEEMQPGITYILTMVDSFMEIIFFIFMFGFAFVLLNSVLMAVFERTREIGIIRAMGSPKDFLFGIIIIESVFLGLLGAGAGVIASAMIILPLGEVGFSFTMFARGMERMGGAGTLFYPVIRLDDIGTGILIVIVMSILSSIYPAWKAIRMEPIDAIHNR